MIVVQRQFRNFSAIFNEMMMRSALF